MTAKTINMLVHTDTVSAALKAAELDAVARTDNLGDWEDVSDALLYQAVVYDSTTIDYRHAYFCSAGWTLQDASLVLRNDGKPCGLWPLTIGGPFGELCVSSAGASVLAPVFVPGLSSRTVKKICNRVISFLRELCAKLGVAVPPLEQDAEPSSGSEGVSEWHQLLLGAGATTVVRHDLYVDLRSSMSAIRASFRKSYRPLINVGLANWFVFEQGQGSANELVWAEFKDLHRVVSGQSTRSDETWALQFKMMETGHAFLVGLRDPADLRLVGAGFFQCTRDEGLYAVAAYDRSLFAKPLGHVVQQRAIEIMKARGLRWYRLGERIYRQVHSTSTVKEVTISEFKQGFASHLFCRFQFMLPN